ncbi:ABC transporter permease [Clostridium estertheticum]|uniref:ABC transporter permease n=1 Tax=Clostridium estertheticum TaxID=238834 RepID=UPI001C0B0B8E|nr:ABC transporter permease [Clostridium estertheticum]MBU3174378.1 ABC transporter permease [Clostridium estertheticum]
MYGLVKCELLKLKRQKVIPISIIITFIPILLGLFSFKTNYAVFKDVNTSDWLKAWSQVGTFYAPIMLPIIASVYCAIIFRVEYANGNLKIILSTPVSRKSIYKSKVIISALMVLFLQAVFGISYFIFGKLFGITGSFPISKMLELLILGWVGILPLIAIQIHLSLKYEDFTKPIMIASICSLCGFFIGTISGIKYLWPWALQKIPMDLSSGGIEGVIPKAIYILYCLIFAGAMVMIGTKKFEDMEIR